MIRITLRTDAAANLGHRDAGAYSKLLVPEPGGTLSERDLSPDMKQRVRTYTIRKIRPGEVDIDFVSHGPLGIAGPWAAEAKPGDRILMSQPGTLKYNPEDADSFLFAADMAALPAAAAILETLPASAVGYAFFEALSDEDRVPVSAPEGIDIQWITKADPKAPSDALVKAVKDTPVSGEAPSVFFAGEFSWIGELRRHIKGNPLLSKERTYVSSYWKVGAVEPEHKAAKAAAM